MLFLVDKCTGVDTNVPTITQFTVLYMRMAGRLHCLYSYT